jgi:hypothetical protein
MDETERKRPASELPPAAAGRKRRRTAKAGARGAARMAARGDVPPRLTASGIEEFTVEEAVDAAVESKAHAVRDILARAAGGDSRGLPESFEAILAGASPDDVLALRSLLEESDEEARKVRRDQADGEQGDDDQLEFHVYLHEGHEGVREIDGPASGHSSRSMRRTQRSHTRGKSRLPRHISGPVVSFVDPLCPS